MVDTKELLTELDVMRGALRAACAVIRKMKRKQRVDSDAFLAIATRTMNESRAVANQAKAEMSAGKARSATASNGQRASS